MEKGMDVEPELTRVELFDGIDTDALERLSAIARPRSLQAGEYVFLLGDAADRLHAVLQGSIALCFPLSFSGTLRDATVETVPMGGVFGWSALVKPYRFTLSARALEPSRLASFPRQELHRLFDEKPRLGYLVMRRITEIVGVRFLKVQALWAREVQRAIASPGRFDEPEALEEKEG